MDGNDERKDGASPAKVASWCSKHDDSIGEWDQFKANEGLYRAKVPSSFDEALYSTVLDKSKVDAEKMIEAQQIAREIESERSTNIHIAEERGHVIEGDYDEEDRYSGVWRTHEKVEFHGSTVQMNSNETTPTMREAMEQHLLPPYVPTNTAGGMPAQQFPVPCYPGMAPAAYPPFPPYHGIPHQAYNHVGVPYMTYHGPPPPCYWQGMHYDMYGNLVCVRNDGFVHVVPFGYANPPYGSPPVGDGHDVPRAGGVESWTVPEAPSLDQNKKRRMSQMPESSVDGRLVEDGKQMEDAEQSELVISAKVSTECEDTIPSNVNQIAEKPGEAALPASSTLVDSKSTSSPEHVQDKVEANLSKSFIRVGVMGGPKAEAKKEPKRSPRDDGKPKSLGVAATTSKDPASKMEQTHTEESPPHDTFSGTLAANDEVGAVRLAEKAAAADKVLSEQPRDSYTASDTKQASNVEVGSGPLVRRAFGGSLKRMHTVITSLCVLMAMLGLDRTLASQNGLRAISAEEESVIDQFQPNAVSRSVVSLCEELTNLFDPNKKKCFDGREYGESCKMNSECFTSYCSDSKCQCPNNYCNGCTSSAAPCIRIEQTRIDTNLEVCGLSVESRSGRRLSIFSPGGAHTDDYEQLPFLALAESTTRCLLFSPFRSPLNLPPAFVQANIDASDSDIALIDVMVRDKESLIDSPVFLSGEWITTLAVEDFTTSGKDLISFSAPVLRREPTSIDDLRSRLITSVDRFLMFVVPICDEETLDFDIPSDMGVELYQNSSCQNPHLSVGGDVNVNGRLSLKNLTIGFEYGALLVGGPTIFQYCTIEGVERCPSDSFQVFGGLCLYATDTYHNASEAESVCSDEADGAAFVQIDQLDSSARNFVAESLLLPNEYAWVGSNSSQCSTLDSTGAASSLSDGECEQFSRILCGTQVKESILRVYSTRRETSYFTDQKIVDHRELFSILEDPARLPIQLGGTLSVTQGDTDVEHVVSHQRPTAIRVEVIGFGNEHVEVALDTYAQPSPANASHYWPFSATSRLPSRVQLHSDYPACVERVDVFLRNETDFDHLAMSIPASIFATCLDYNICSNSTEDLCSRSLMYYDEERRCAVLSPDEPKYPRDLTFKLFTNECDRLSSWNHPLLGLPFQIEVAADYNVAGMEPSGITAVGQPSTEQHQYKFSANSSYQVNLTESTVVPVLFEVSGSSSKLIAIRLKRYDVIGSVQGDLVWDCINICDATADSEGIYFGENRTERVYLNLVEAVDCRKVGLLKTTADETGREVCTCPAVNVSSSSEISVELEKIVESSYPCRTALLKAIDYENELRPLPIDIPERRGLTLLVDLEEADEEACIGDASFTVNKLSEMHVQELCLDGETTITVHRLGLADVSLSTLSRNALRPLIANSGLTVCTDVVIDDGTILGNMDSEGTMEFANAEFRGTSYIDNSQNGTIELTRMRLYESFPNPLQLDRTLLLPDKRRFYLPLSDEVDEPYCTGVNVLDQSLNIDVDGCIDVCEESASCSGIISSFNEEGEAVCGLCLRESCSFNCTDDGSLYLKPESKFQYTEIIGCPLLDRPFSTFSGLLLEECKLFCSYYPCEAFTFTASNASESECVLIGDFDFASAFDQCEIPQATFIPYSSNDTGDFVAIPGLLVDPTQLGRIEDISADECSAVCMKTIDCSSFTLLEAMCTLYKEKEFELMSEETGLYINVGDIFPKNLYATAESSCFNNEPFASFNTKSASRCKSRCSDDLTCAASSFTPFVTHAIANCFLYDRNAAIDGLSCDATSAEEPLAATQVVYTRETYIESSGGVFIEAQVYDEVVLDECKSVCLHDVNCIAIQYDSTNRTCATGIVEAGFSNETYLVLESRSSSLREKYLRTSACFSGTPIPTVELTSPEASKSLTRWSMSCAEQQSTQGSSYVGNGNLTSEECTFLCAGDPSCEGFLYFVDYGGPVNRDRIGQCELLTRPLVFGCDAVQLNTDLYLLSSKGGLCEARCNVNDRCIGFVYDFEAGCQLFSDIALEEPDGTCEETLIHVGQSFRERDAFIAIPGQCLIEFENAAEIACFPLLTGDTERMNETSSVGLSSMTPHACQQACKEDGFAFYAVSSGNRCDCFNENFFEGEDRATSDGCNATCTGDASQLCGGTNAALVGSCNLPLLGLTEGQCKRKCFESRDCSAIIFREAEGECELRSSALFDDCSVGTQRDLVFIESLEHYYEDPIFPYAGATTIHIASLDLVEDCQVLCDKFLLCEAIWYDEASSLNNCHLLTGDLVSPDRNTSEGVLVARDVNLFTLAYAQGYGSDASAKLTEFDNVFEIDECRTMCEEHARCGSIVFSQQTCELYKQTSFAETSDPNSLAEFYYINYRTFVDLDQNFVEAENLCLVDGSVLISSRNTVQSEYDCASRCNLERECKLFTFNEGTSECVLYTSEVELTNQCSGAAAKTYVMFRPAQFTRKDTECLSNEGVGERVFEKKSVVTCAALCDEWFNCRSFRIDATSGLCQLFQSEQFSNSSCMTLASPPLGDLFVYYSDFFYVQLPSSFCVAENSILASIDDAPVEACKFMCDSHVECVAMKHNQNGDCSLYASSDFTIDCLPNDDRSLYVSYERIVDPERPAFQYRQMDDCFNLGDEDVVVTESCEEACSDEEDCFGYQTDEQTCKLLIGSLPEAGNCTVDELSYLRTATNPYQRMENTCLRRPLYDPNAIFVKGDYGEYECLALCDAHPFCRYFLYSGNATIPNLGLHECVLFEAQVEPLDNCDDYDGPYSGLTALVNGRTFLDIVSRFGFGLSTFASFQGLSYQECASLCDSLEKCKSFFHTWNYRLSDGESGRPQMFTRTRLLYLDFGPGNSAARFLWYDETTETLSVLPGATDEEVGLQSILFEPAGDGAGQFKVRFSEELDLCIGSGPGLSLVALEEGPTRDAILQNFDGAAPGCQRLALVQCDSPEALVFDPIEQEDGLALEYKYPFDDPELRGCVRFLGAGPSYVEGASSIGDLNITASEVCQPPISFPLICTRIRTRIYTEDGVVSGWVVEQPCTITETATCTAGEPTETNVRPTSFTSAVVTTCKSPSDELYCSFSNERIANGVTTETETCVFQTDQTATLCTYIQKDGWDLLSEQNDFYNERCFSQNVVITGTSLNVVGSSYGYGCRFDEKVASFPTQYFSFASNPSVLSNDRTGLCFGGQSDDEYLSLSACNGRRGRTWTYLFNGRQLFTTNANDEMVCATRGSTGLLVTSPCDSRDPAARATQEWLYDSTNGLLVVPNSGNADCIVADPVSQQVAIGNCTDAEARWSRFSKCALSTRSSTRRIKLKSVDDENGRCLNREGNNLTLCSSSSNVGRWRYYYDPERPRLELSMGSNRGEQCLGRVPDEFGESDLKDLPTGLVNCSSGTNDETFPYWRMLLFGEEYNVFGFENEAVDYCVRVPGNEQSQTLCSSPASVGETQRWKRDGEFGGVNIVSVKPSALLNEVTDPELLFQLFLFTAEGRQLRILRAKSAELSKVVGEGLAEIVETEETLAAALGLLNAVAEPTDSLLESMTDGSSFFKVCNTVLLPVTFIQYVGTAVKPPRKISGQLNKALDKGKKSVKKVNSTLAKLEPPLARFEGAVSELGDSLSGGIVALQVLVTYVSRSAYCAYQEGLIDEYERLQEWVRELIKVIGAGIPLVRGVGGALGALNDFSSVLTKNAKVPLNGFKTILGGVDTLVKELDFVPGIADFRLRVQVPNIKKFKLESRDLTLDLIGRTLASVFNKIKKIPLLGDLLRTAERLMDAAIAIVFKGLGLETPYFGLSFGFVDTIQAGLESAQAELQKPINYLQNMVSLGSRIPDRVEEIINAATESLPALPVGVLSGCEDAECLDLLLNISNLPQIEILDDVGPIPGLRVGDTNFTLPAAGFDILDAISSSYESITEAVEELLDSGIDCDEYKTVTVNFGELLRSKLNVNLTAIGIPDCPYNFKVCSSPRMDGIDDFTTTMTDLLENVGLGSGRRLQESCFQDGVASFAGIEIPIVPSSLSLYKLWDAILPRIKTQSEKQQRSRTNNQLRRFWRSTIQNDDLGWRYPFKEGSRSDQFELGYKGTNFEVTILNLFEKPNVHIVLGCDRVDRRFRATLKVGPLLRSSATVWFGKFTPTRQGEKAIKEDERKKSNFEREFDFESREAAIISDILCKLTFIYATDRVLRQYRAFPNNNDQKNFVDDYVAKNKDASNVAVNVVAVERLRNERAVELWDGDLPGPLFGKSIYTQQERVTEWWQTSIKWRAAWQTYRIENYGKEGSAGAFLRDRSDLFRKEFPRGGRCAGPTTLYDLFNINNEDIKFFPKAGTDDVADLNNQKLKEFFAGLDFRLDDYSKLFSGKVYVSWVRQAVLGNFQIENTELPFRQYLRFPGLENIDDESLSAREEGLLVWNATGLLFVIWISLFIVRLQRLAVAAEFKVDDVAVGFDKRGLDLKDALEVAPEIPDIELLTSFSSRNGIRIDSHLFHFTINLDGDGPAERPMDDTFCSGRFCVSAGALSYPEDDS